MTTALVVCTNGTEDIEYLSCVDILNRGGVHVTTCAVNTAEERLVNLANGNVVLTNTTIEDVDGDFDIIVVPGGPKTDSLNGSDKFIDLLKQQKANNKKIAAICAAPYVVLYKNGILQKHDNMTCYPGCDNEGIFKSCEIAITDNQQIITANGPFNAIKFALTILREFVSEDAYNEVAKAILAI